MAALPPEEILATEPGDQKLEVQQQRTFRALRAPGQREWFYAGRELLDHIQQILAQHGMPSAGLSTLRPSNGMLNTCATL